MTIRKYKELTYQKCTIPMKINLFVLQQHIESSKTHEQPLDVQHMTEIRKYNKVTVQGKGYEVQQIRTTKNPLVLDALCLYLPYEGNPELLKELGV